MRYVIAIGLLLLPGHAAAAQSASLRVEVRAGADPVSGAEVIVSATTHTTDAEGVAILNVPPGTTKIVVIKEGFAPATTVLALTAGQEQQVIVELVALPAIEEAVTVSATRTGARLEDSPMRVEVLGREEIEEKMLMTPGDIVMMLNEMGGMRVQATSPSLGAASVRIQGMRGRYTRVLSDGLPLFGEQVGGLGLLQIPPMDLGQVEVIKGVASALYGAGAMGGVINLLSRRPGREPQREAMLNRSTRGATDAVLWLSSPLSDTWSGSLLTGGHFQQRTDVDEDAWADLAGYGRAVLRPRIFRDNGKGSTLFATAGMTYEDRTGGTMPDAVAAPIGGAYREALETWRFDAGIVAQTLWRGRYVISARAAAASQSHDHLFGDTRERDRHATAFGEASVRGAAGRHTWVAGMAVEHDRYRPRDVPRFAYSFTAPGLFAQDDVELASWLSASASARLDWHSEYGTFVSPRLSALLRFGAWSSRVSWGLGFAAPTPLTEETEAAGLTRLQVPSALRAERGQSASIDVTRTIGVASLTATAFGSRVAHPVRVERSTVYELRNSDGPTTNIGMELLTTVRREPFAVTGTYTYVRSREESAAARVDAPLTPRHSAGVVGMWEDEERGRVGVEVYYTGRQRLEENAFRAQSEPYVILGLLGEYRLRSARVFINFENLTGVRQTEFDPLLRPSRAVDGRWTVDAWAPLEGRVINGGVRVRF